jgi:hypothetical protein
MKIALPAIAMLALCVGCRARSSGPLTDPVPQPTAPRVLLPAARVAEIATSAAWLERYAPYWDPAAEDLRRCEAALGRTHRSETHKELGSSLIQYFGVTQHDRPRIAMLGVCAEQAERYADTAARRLIGSLHGGPCEFRAVCDPASDSIPTFSPDPLGRR